MNITSVVTVANLGQKHIYTVHNVTGDNVSFSSMVINILQILRMVVYDLCMLCTFRFSTSRFHDACCHKTALK